MVIETSVSPFFPGQSISPHPLGKKVLGME